MDRDLARLEHDLAAGDERARLPLARAYARACRNEEAWDQYRQVEETDPTLDAVGRALGATERAALEDAPVWVELSAPGPGLPVEALKARVPVDEELPTLPALPFLRSLSVEPVELTVDLLQSLPHTPRLRELSLRGEEGLQSGPDRFSRLQPQAVSDLVERWPNLRSLTLTHYSTDDSLALRPLSALASSLTGLDLLVSSTQDMVWEWLPELSRLTTLLISDTALAFLPAELVTLRVPYLHTPRSLEAVWAHPRLEAFELQSKLDPSWLPNVPPHLRRLGVGEVGHHEFSRLVEVVRERPHLSELKLQPTPECDLSSLAELSQLQALELPSPLSLKQGRALLGFLPNLRELRAQETSYTALEFARLLQDFKGDVLDIGFGDIPWSRLLELRSLELQELGLWVAHMDERTAAVLKERIEEVVTRVEVVGERRGGIQSLNVIEFLRIALDAPELRLTTQWSDTPFALRTLAVLETSFALSLPSTDALGHTVESTVSRVIDHLHEQDR